MVTCTSLISVIVPVYKVEDFLDECVESIVCQTYTNLEIILVDDGSTDSCPAKCDYWAQKDQRIVVLHKENGGLSSARNAGLEIATGEYIGFVDSDDYIAPNMYEELLKGFQNGANLAVTCGMVVAFNDCKKFPYNEKWLVSESRITSYNEFYVKILNSDVCHTVWSKLYRFDVIKKIRFKEGRNNEDTLYHFELSKVLEYYKLGMLEIPLNVYYYRIRQGSICNDSHMPLALDTIKNLIEMENYFNEQKDVRASLVRIHYVRTVFLFCIKIIFNKSWMEKYYEQYYAELSNFTFNEIYRAYPKEKNMLIHFFLLKYLPFIYIRIKRLKGF